MRMLPEGTSHHGDVARTTRIFKHLDLLVWVGRRVCPGITDPQSVLQCLVREHLHAVREFILVGASHFAV